MKHTVSSRASIFLIFVFCIAASLTGCAVLTSSQVREVKNFAKASEAYTQLPGSLAQAYGVLLRNHKLLAVSRYEFGKMDAKGGIDTLQSNKAWENIKKAYDLEQELHLAGKRMDKSLAVLKSYSQILSILVSDDYSDALGKKAAELGKSLDESIETYNKEYRADNPVKEVGGLIAQVVRGAGGIYIRHRQFVILRDTLKDADPLISDLMPEVRDIALNQMKPAFENYERNYLGKEFKSVANNSKRLSVNAMLFVYENLRRTREAVLLSDQVATAAIKYKLAHARLVQKTRSRENLKQIIDEIKTLSREVEEANKVKKKVEK